MQSTKLSTQPLALVSRELFPHGLTRRGGEFRSLFDEHGLEVRGRAFELDYGRYSQLQKQGRLVWIVARADELPVGYCCSFWYRDLHYCADYAATDDLWYVMPAFRRRGIGTELKKCCHVELHRHGIRRVYDNIRGDEHAPLMGELGYEKWATRWIKTL